jgi:hypothetical protein
LAAQDARAQLQAELDAVLAQDRALERSVILLRQLQRQCGGLDLRYESRQGQRLCIGRSRCTKGPATQAPQ